MMHRFAEARHHLEQAEIRGAQEADVSRLRLSIDQACGTDLDRVLDERRETVRRSGAIEDQVALGGLLADLREFSDADRTYRQALRNYRDVSPFPVAWVCFQLGVLWGELVPEPRTTCAARWYERALARLPSYTKARVHLAEIYSSCGRADDAEPCSCQRFRVVIRKCAGGSLTPWPSKAKMRRCRSPDARPPAPDSNLSLIGTRSHSPITVRNSTPEAAMILAELLSLRSSTLPIVRHYGPSSRHTKWPFPPVTPTPQLRFSEKPSSVGEILPGSICRHWQHAASQNGKEQPHDIDRRAFVAGTTLVAFAPAIEFLPALLSPPAANASRLVFMIDGWSVPNDSADEVWIRVGRSWRTAWR